MKVTLTSREMLLLRMLLSLDLAAVGFEPREITVALALRKKLGALGSEPDPWAEHAKGGKHICSSE